MTIDPIRQRIAESAVPGFGTTVRVTGSMHNARAIIVDSNGQCYIYQDTGSGWIRQTQFAGLSTLLNVDICGTLNNTAVIVGSPDYATDGVISIWTGTADSTVWTEHVYPPTDSDTAYGRTVAMSGSAANDSVALFSCLDASGVGKVHALHSDDDGTAWHRVTVPHPNDLTSSDMFGSSVSVTGSRRSALAIVGALGYNGTGAVFMYTLSPEGDWALHQVITHADLGNAVCITGHTNNAIAMVARYVSSGDNDPLLHVYHNTGSGWVADTDFLQVKSYPLNEQVQSQMTVSVTGTATSCVALVGYSSGPQRVGVVTVYRKLNNRWNYLYLLTRLRSYIPAPTRVDLTDTFGSSVDIAGQSGQSFAMIGIPSHDTVYVFEEPPACFHGSVMIETDHGPVYANRVRVGTRVLCEDGRYRSVRTVVKRSGVQCVDIPENAFDRACPSRRTLLTPNHLIKLPCGNIIPARTVPPLSSSTTPIVRRNHRHLTLPVTVYHFGLDGWHFIWANGLRAETLA